MSVHWPETMAAAVGGGGECEGRTQDTDTMADDASGDARPILMETCCVGDGSVGMQSGGEAWKGREEEEEEEEEGESRERTWKSGDDADSVCAEQTVNKDSKPTGRELPPFMEDAMAESNIKLGKRSRKAQSEFSGSTEEPLNVDSVFQTLFFIRTFCLFVLNVSAFQGFHYK